MVQIPYFLIDNQQLDIYERAVIPLVIRHTIGWADRKIGVEAFFLSQILQIDVKTVISVLDALVSKGILETVQLKDKAGRSILYSLSKKVLNHQADKKFELLHVSESRHIDDSSFLNLSDTEYKNLRAYALKLVSSLGLSEDVVVDFELFQRSKNTKSYDWPAEFQRWALRENKKTTGAKVAKYDSSFKPTPEQFQLTQHFIEYLRKIDPQFIEPTDWSWAQEIKILIEIEGYSAEDIVKAIEWLFSAKGDWYRPNVADAFALREKFSYIISQVRSYRDTKEKVPDNIDIFDLYENN